MIDFFFILKINAIKQHKYISLFLASTAKTSTLGPEISPAFSGRLAASPHCSLTVLKGVWHFDKSFWVYLHYHVSCWVLWRPVLLFGVLCLPSRQFHCYLGPARLTQESYKWALRNVMARVWPYTTFILMNKTWGNIYLLCKKYTRVYPIIMHLYFCLCLSQTLFLFLLHT